ncbi:putative RNA-directed DNA polymerase [Helianthus annuus]|nr:putative RNA-directed DNA polymerase [Helianthus annuus]KAJ0871191.1 putative RNA-directed DNA polymerase [Helianthus annuus]
MAEEASNFQVPSVPRFDGDYDHWSLVMETLLRSKELWVAIEIGFKEPREGEQLTPTQRTNLEAMRIKDLKARNYLYQSIDKQILKTMTQKESAKKIWEAMKLKYQGNARVKRAQLQRLRRNFELLEMKDGETINDYFSRVMIVANDMRNFGEDMSDLKVVEKILRSLTENFNFVVCTIEESKDIDTLSVDELQSSLLVHEQKLTRKNNDDQVLKMENDSTYGRGTGRGRSSSSRGRGRGRGRGRSNFDKSTIECYKCHQTGHFQYECPRGEKTVNYAEFDEGEDLLLMASVEAPKEPTKGIWFLDSACSNHMTGGRDWFISLDESFNHTVKLGNDLRLTVRGIGDIRLEVEGITQVITRVYYVPELTSSLLSLGQLQEKGLTIIIKQGTCKVYHPQRGLIVTSNMTRNRMFLVNGTMRPLNSRCLKIDEECESQVWHKRFGHANNKSIRTMQYRQLVKGLPKMAEQSKVCEVCNLGKQQREIIPKKSTWRAAEKLQLIHTDLCGPIKPVSPSGKRYVMVLVDDYSRKGWVYFLANKSESFEAFKRFKVMVENETSLKIKSLRSDRGGEFTSKTFNDFCDVHGIKRQLTAAYTPQQNGVAERRNKTLMNMVRCLLIEKQMPKWFWTEAANWACHILNRCVTSALEDRIPEEVWSGNKPNVDYFKIFGCIGYVHVPSQLRTKLDNKSHKCIFLGISKESKAYKLYDPVQQKIVISRDVIFEEMKQWDWKHEELDSQELLIPDDEEVQNEERYDTVENDSVDVQEQEAIQQNPFVNTEDTEQDEAVGSVPNVALSSQQDGSQRSKRTTRTPVWMQDYQTGEGFSDEEADLAMFSSFGDPTSYEEAVKETKWVDAMKNEIQAIEQNETWELVEASKEVKPIGVKWVFKTKLNERGQVEKHKARLVVKGYAQKKGIDYDEVFAPVARWDTIRSLLAIAAQNDWTVRQLDVKSAFLNGELKETVFIEQPEGFVKSGEEHKVYRLKRALYGLKQAPRAWFNRIEGYFQREGFRKSRSMMQEFEMTDLGTMKYFLGIEVNQYKEGISICQKKYAKEVLERFGMWESNGVKNPIVPGTVLTKAGGGKEVDGTEFKRLVGSLMYLTVTRPDIMYVVCLISRFMSNPKEEHLQLAKRVLRYVKDTYNFGLLYARKSGLKLQVYTDSDFARDREDRRCTSGYVCLLSEAAICWSSRKQEIVTLSSTDAEYVAATTCACHCVWLKGLLQEMSNKLIGTVEVKCDNNSTIKLSKNPVMHRRTKHIDVRFHYLRDLVNQEQVQLVFCPTGDQVADVMTKPVKLEVFEKMRKLMGVKEIEGVN